jgi:hypothetical protein
MSYTYKFVRLPVNVAAPRAQHPHHPSYEEVIAAHAAQGWRFVQLIQENPSAVPAEYVLVFEQPAPPAA